MSEPQGDGTGGLGRIDLHTHSDCSDGTLAPLELVRLAAERSVSLLALTDHDTLAGLDEAQHACERSALRFVGGVELSCLWRASEIHVLGLGIEVRDADLQQLCHAQQARRRRRIRAIGERLTALGLPGDAISDSALASASPTRAHLARGLHERGFADSAQQAFERYLAPGRSAYVPPGWPRLDEIMDRLRSARGLAVLAHPHRYRLARAALTELACEFKQLGGGGIEVSMAGMSPTQVAGAARLARRFELAGSIGSDFHQPGIPWRPLGRLVKLPEAVTPVTARLGTAT